jgi:Lon protease-like protein
MDIATVGSERFRLLGVRRDLPYLVGSAVPWPLEGADADQAWEKVESVRAIFQRYLQLLAQATGDQIEIEEIPLEPRALALLVAAALQLPLSQKQSLLSQPAIADLLQAELSIMHREQSILQYILGTQSEQWQGGHSGYLSKN